MLRKKTAVCDIKSKVKNIRVDVKAALNRVDPGTNDWPKQTVLGGS